MSKEAKVKEEVQETAVEDRGDTLSEESEVTETLKAEEQEQEEEVTAASGEKEPEEQEEQEEAAKTPADRLGLKVPKFRLDAMTARARHAEEELERIRNAAPETGASKDDETDQTERLDQIDEEIAEAVQNSDHKRVAALMRESRNLERMRIQEEMQDTRQSASTDAQEAVRVDSILDQAENTYAEFDENSKQFNQELNDKVIELQGAYMASGKSQSEALVEAINIGAALYSIEPRSSTKEDKPTPRKTDVTRNGKAAKAQPADLGDIGDDTTAAGQQGSKLDAADLTEEEFDALPESKLRAARGDFVE